MDWNELNDGDYYQLYDIGYFEGQAEIAELENSRRVEGLFGEHYESMFRIHNSDRITRELQKDVDDYVDRISRFAYSRFLETIHKEIVSIVREIFGNIRE